MTSSFWVSWSKSEFFHLELFLEDTNSLLNNCDLPTMVASFVCKTWSYLIGALCCMGWRTMCRLSWWLVLINMMRSQCYWLVYLKQPHFLQYHTHTCAYCKLSKWTAEQPWVGLYKVVLDLYIRIYYQRSTTFCSKFLSHTTKVYYQN